jgi:TolA-binding protein
MRARLSPPVLLLTHARRMDGFCNQNAEQQSLKQEQSLLSMQSEISDMKKRTSPDESMPKRLVDLHEHTRDLEAKVSSLVSSNNVINSHIEKLQAQSSSDKQVQMVFAPRRH